MFHLPVLTKHLWFPDPNSASANGLLAVGGDLSPERLLLAYRSGIFPWSINPITWWSPDPRAIFDLDHFHVSRSFARILRQQPFRITFDHAFSAVIQSCAEPRPGRMSTWITPEFIAAYTQLHQLGFAHSCEAWTGQTLVGGIYGVAIGGLFAGESMFHNASNASKIALYHLVQHLRHRRFTLFDIQQANPHTAKLGAIQIPRQQYLDRLRPALTLPCQFS